ncbi:MAG: hypothetical protein ACOYOB_21170 [Myxococcota bacterium]
MKLKDYLHQDAEPTPAWLARFDSSSRFDCNDFFGSRVVFYPGSGNDGHAVKVFGGAHAAHAFVMADYLVAESDLLRKLAPASLRRFAGYSVAVQQTLREVDVVPGGWRPHVDASDGPDRNPWPLAITPFALFVVLEREPAFGDDHGPERLAILFLGADGIATYDAVFCQEQDRFPPPYAVLLQDHGFGANYDRFGADGLLANIAARTQTWPQWLLVAASTRPWPGFQKVQGIEGSAGGMHGELRWLHGRVAGAKAQT